MFSCCCRANLKKQIKCDKNKENVRDECTKNKSGNNGFFEETNIEITEMLEKKSERQSKTNEFEKNLKSVETSAEKENETKKVCNDSDKILQFDAVINSEKLETKRNETVENNDSYKVKKSICDKRSTNSDQITSIHDNSKENVRGVSKTVSISNNTELIPPCETPSVDDDDVFSDSVSPKLSRRHTCAPYIAKTGSTREFHGLPHWFKDERFLDEHDGNQEPPVTPVGRDELALKRHRMYSELLMAAQAAVEHRVRFDPLGPDIATTDYNSDVKSSFLIELENSVDRLEKLICRLENTIITRELELANRKIDLKEIDSSLIHNCAHIESVQDNKTLRNLERRINRIETSLKEISRISELEYNPIVSDEHLLINSDKSKFSSEDKMSVAGYQDIVNGSLSQYVALSNKIGGDVAKHAQLVKTAFDAQLQYVIYASQYSQPPQTKQMELLKPTSDQITAIQDFREKNRASKFFNHLSAISESIPALGWVCVAPTPGPHVKEMNDAGQFYTNRVLKDWKEKDATHVEWVKAWIQTLNELQKYIKQFHTTGLVWSGKNNAGSIPPPPSALGCPPPPPPPPVAAFDDLCLEGTTDERSALFAEINQGEAITKNLKRVTADMQTHKNPTLRTGPAPFKTPHYGTTDKSSAQKQADRTPVFTRDGKKWLIEYQKSNQGLMVDNAEMNNVVYMFRCQDSTLTIKGKVNSVVMDSCKKCSILFDSVVSSIEFVNCQSVQMQVLGKVPTISIDKTDGCQMYLSKESLNVEIISSKSSEMNVILLKDNGDYIEQPIPEQYKTTIRGTTLQTVCVESLG